MSDIDTVKDRLDIVDVVSQYVPLLKAGRNFKAVCPFHSERTPSFYVSPERQSWHCFGACGTGGDVISFVMKKESMEFSEALRELADRAGVQLTPRNKGEDEARKSLYQINEAAADYFHCQLIESPEAKGTRDYLLERDVSRESIERFQLGFSPASGNALAIHLKGQGIKPEELVSAGLVIAGDDNVSRDMFRGRLMFPICDERGRNIGFGGRSLTNIMPKYLNTPQTDLFDKSSILYGVDKAKAAIREQNRVVVVEGYTDVLTAHQHGFRNVVASMGTALTEKQVGMLKRLAQKISLAMDSDTAGQEATLRSLESSWNAFSRRVHKTSRRGPQFLEGPPQHTVDVIAMPTGKDPDDVIRESEDGWLSLTENTVPLLDYYIQALASRVNLDAPGARAGILERVSPLLVTMDFLDQDRYVQKLSHVLGVSRETLKVGLRPQQPRTRRTSSRVRDTRGEPEPITVADEDTTLEQYVLVLLLHYPDLKSEIEGLSLDDFSRMDNRELFQAYIGSADLDEMRNVVSESLLDYMDELTSRELPPANYLELRSALSQCKKRLRERRLKELKTEEEYFLAQEEIQGEEVSAIQKKGVDINSQLRSIHRGTPTPSESDIMSN